MIVKERKPPITLLKLEVLLRRLPKEHSIRSTVESDFMKIKSGYVGEKKVDYYLNFLPKKEYSIFHNIRLKSEDHFFQIDTLIITSKYILLLEIKNMLGNLMFDRNFINLFEFLGKMKKIFLIQFYKLIVIKKS